MLKTNIQIKERHWWGLPLLETMVQCKERHSVSKNDPKGPWLSWGKSSPRHRAGRPTLAGGPAKSWRKGSFRPKGKQEFTRGRRLGKRVHTGVIVPVKTWNFKSR